MDLSYSEEQNLLRDSAERFLAQRYSFQERQAFVQNDRGMSAEIWREFGDLGWLALPISEDHGGVGGSPVDIAILMEAFGRALVVEPFLASTVLATQLITIRATEEQRAELLPQLASGEMICAVAHLETTDDYVLEQVDTIATRDGAGWRLDGTKSIVAAGPQAQLLLVTARVGGLNNPVGVFAVPTSSPGISQTVLQTLDGSRASNILFRNVQLSADSLLGDASCALSDVKTAFDHGATATMAEAVGAMRALLEATVNYTKQRQQFGRPLAGNQVVRHRLADMAVAVEEAAAASLRATLMLTAEARTRARAVSSAKLKVGATARFVAEQAVQLHGGMGVTDELNIGAYFKRLLAFEVSFGDADFHRNRHVQLSPRAAIAS